METVAIVGPVDALGKKRIREQLPSSFLVKEISSQEDYGQLADVEYVILRILKMDSDAIAQAPKLKLIQRWGAGYDTVDIETAGKKGIKVAIAGGINSIPVSEFAVMLMLAVSRNLTTINQRVKKGIWSNDELIARSYTIRGKMIGLIGLGNIGRQVAQKVLAFGARVCYYDPYRLTEETELSLGIQYMDFDQLVEQADIISVHVPLTDTTRNMIHAGVIARMKHNAIIINTARGGIINEADLYQALLSGKLLGAGLDVFETAGSSDNPLMTLDNVVVSSHLAGNTADNSIFMADRCVENICLTANDRPVTTGDLVNADYIKELS